VLLDLPHRQFVFTMPKALRPFFRHDRRLFSSVSRLIFALLAEFYAEAAGRPLMTGMIVAHQTYGDMLRFNPHFHAIVLEGGFDDEGTFFYVPFSGLDANGLIPATRCLAVGGERAARRRLRDQASGLETLRIQRR